MYLVEFGFSEGQQVTTTTVSSLIVMIIDKDQSITIGHQTWKELCFSFM